MSKPSSRKNPRKPIPTQHKPARQRVNWWLPIASILVLGAGLYRAIALRWISDDAFITMRYVKNFVEGKGLVYNVGERVEGYTHFLWLMLLAAAKAIGFDPVDASIWLGIAAYVGILVLLLAISLREHKKNSKMIWLPVAAALFALNYDTEEWASGGLETSFYTLLILAAFYLWFYSRFSEQRRLLLTGIALALVALTRPDGVLFTATAASLLAIRGIRSKQRPANVSKTIGLLLLPSIVIGAPYLLWKYFYYGDILPLTYYTKSAGDDYFAQGFFYIWLYFRVHFISAIALIAALFLLVRKNKIKDRPPEDSYRGSPSSTAFAAIVVYLLLFVARVGGDFMFARFIIPVVPFFCFIIEQALERMPAGFVKYRIGVAVALLASVIAEEKLFTTELFHLNDEGTREENWNLVVAGKTHFIADERWYYYDHEINGLPRGNMEAYTLIGKFLEPFFKGLPITVAIPGSMNMIAYYADLPMEINEYGLTDAYIAHLPLSTRGHIGHEKKAPEDYLLKRHVNFEILSVTPNLPEPSYNLIAFEIPELGVWQLARLVTYDKPLMNELASRFRTAGTRCVLPLFERILPDYIEQEMPRTPLAQLKDDYAGFRQYYFDRYPDSILQHRFEQRISELEEDSITKSR
jgi:hypothetical protein